MADYARQYEQELKRVAPFQEEPAWRDWLAAMAEGIDDFFRLVPGMPDDPWSEAGMRHAEQAALTLFADRDAASPRRSPDNVPIIDPFIRFLGEVYVRRFGGEWVYVDLGDDGELKPAVSLPYASMYLDVGAQLTAAMGRRTGSMWAQVYHRQTSSRQQWIDAGRPSLPDWEQMRDRAAQG